MSRPTVIAQAGHKTLQELQRVLNAESISADIVCPPDANLNA